MLTPYIIPISGRKSRGKNEKFVTNFKILPPRTPGLGICLRHEASRLVIARSEATWQSRSVRLDNRQIPAKSQLPSRDCTPRALPRASRSGRHVGLRPPRNDKLGGRMPQNPCGTCYQPAWRSMSAATDAIGWCIFAGSRYGSAALRREEHAPPLQDACVRHDFLFSGCALRRFSI